MKLSDNHGENTTTRGNLNSLALVKFEAFKVRFRDNVHREIKFPAYLKISHGCLQAGIAQARRLDPRGFLNFLKLPIEIISHSNANGGGLLFGW